MPNNLPAEGPIGVQAAGLDFWMAAVTKQCDEVRRDFDPTSVHDLRVALRRCRSIANGFMALDPDPAWKQMKAESKWLFRQLGTLRDMQVMLAWVHRLSPEPDLVSAKLQSYMEPLEQQNRQEAAAAVSSFNKKKWAAWRRLLSPRTRTIPLEGIVFQHLALERWMDLKAFHRQALHNRSQAAYHRVRLALKKFRYTVENFLPSRHQRWGPELRELQDLLGEMHDLYVLWRTALAIQAVPANEKYNPWRQRLMNAIEDRRRQYHAKMTGRESRLFAWREDLPKPEQTRDAALAHFRAWASFRDPDIFRSEHVAKLSLQIYDGLSSMHLAGEEAKRERDILEAAAFSRTVGFIGDQKRYQKSSCRMIRKIAVPAGLDSDTLQQVALVVRFHRGALPRPDQKALSGISSRQFASITLLSGILRLADAFDRLHGTRVNKLRLDRSGDTLFITAPGYSGSDISAERLAGARHLLESACRLPVLIRGHVHS